MLMFTMSQSHDVSAFRIITHFDHLLAIEVRPVTIVHYHTSQANEFNSYLAGIR